MEEKVNLTFIKAALQEEFTRTYGKPLEWRQVLKNSIVLSHFRSFGFDISTPNHIESFKNMVKEALKENEKYQIIGEGQQFFRANKYRDVTDYRTLVMLAEKNPQGMLADEELLIFTYKDAKSDIQRAVKDKRLKKISFNGNKEQSFFVFPMTIENEFEIRDDKHKLFGQDFYLDICKQFNSKNDDDTTKKQAKGSQGKQSGGGDPNYRLPRYTELKEQWLKRGTKKN